MISSETPAFSGIKGKELATLAAKEIQIIGKQVNHIIGVHDKLVKSSRNRIWDWLRVKRSSVKFVIAEEHLQGLIGSAEKAKISLQSAICLCGLETVNAGQAHMQDAFQLLHNSMKDQAKALERLNRDINVTKIEFDLVDGRGRLVVKPPEPDETSTKSPRCESERSSRRSKKSKTSAKHKHSRKNERARGDSERNIEVAGGYEVVLRNNKAVIMATDTDEDKSATGESDTNTHNNELNRIERALENISQDQWERGMGNHLYKFQLSLSSNSAADPNSLNSDLGNETIAIIIDADKKSRAFVGETTKLYQCVYDETDSMLFCIAYICITETDQTFTIMEPCEQPCRHIEIQIMNKWLTEKNLPCMLDFQSITCGESAGEMAEIQPFASFTLECYHRCTHRKSRSHTILECNVPAQDGRNRQMIVEDPNRLQAWFNSTEQELDTPTGSPGDSDTRTDRPGSTQDDNEFVMALFEMVQREDGEVPTRIPFDALIGYIKLIERLQLDVVHRVQCDIWADAIVSEVSDSFDEKAIARAWVCWKLRRGAEFNTLTVMMQKEGKRLICEQTNQYGVSLPQHTIDAIDRKRIAVLSQIRNLVQDHIQTCRANYLIARTEDNPDWHTPLGILASSMTAGFLTLEYELLLRNGKTEDDESFDGLSFSDTVDWVRSMMNLGDWEIRTVPPARRMPFVLSGLVAMVPLLGVGLHEAGICSALSSKVYEDLKGLIRRLGEEDDWGVDLPNE
ncbi:transporter hol1 [Fusarium sp. NRRL 52700]|nr:transporter hol1 [Fusarium sp. NRRL 52700]